MTDCLVMSIDWRFLCPNFIDLGQVVLILHDFKEKSYFLPQYTFSSEWRNCVFLPCSHVATFWNRNKRLVLKEIWIDKLTKVYQNLLTIFVFPAQTVLKKIWKFNISRLVSKILLLIEGQSLLQNYLKSKLLVLR